MSGKIQEKYEESNLYRIRHSAAHVMAQAVVEIFPEAKYTIGPPIEDGFYYDFDLPRQLTPEDLEKIEKRMRQIIAGNHDFHERSSFGRRSAPDFQGPTYKLELIAGLETGGLDEYGNPLAEKPEISIYQQDQSSPTCAAVRMWRTPRKINPSAVKLMSVAGAYWRGDEKKPDAAADLRHGLADTQRIGRISVADGRSQKTRPPAVGQGIGLFLLFRGCWSWYCPSSPPRVKCCAI